MNVSTAILNHLEQNWAAISAAAAVLFIAAVSCMPPDPPSTMTEYWRWVRESLQTAIPAARRNNNHADPPPIQPEGPAKEK